jgi:hypothetical protein
MATFDWPDAKPFWPRAARWHVLLNQTSSTSALSGYTQVLSLPGARWRLSLDVPEQSYDERHALGAFIERLEGRRHLANIYCPVLRAPRGTIATGGITLAANAAQFAETLQLAGCGAGATLGAYSWLVLAGQRLRVVADATANGSGVMTVQVRHSLRQAAASGSPVAVSLPRSTMGLHMQGQETPTVPYDANGRGPAFTLEFVERWA